MLCTELCCTLNYMLKTVQWCPVYTDTPFVCCRVMLWEEQKFSVLKHTLLEHWRSRRSSQVLFWLYILLTLVWGQVLSFKKFWLELGRDRGILGYMTLKEGQNTQTLVVPELATSTFIYCTNTWLEVGPPDPGPFYYKGLKYDWRRADMNFKLTFYSTFNILVNKHRNIKKNIFIYILAQYNICRRQNRLLMYIYMWQSHINIQNINKTE